VNVIDEALSDIRHPVTTCEHAAVSELVTTCLDRIEATRNAAGRVGKGR
jgi:hypothetical protein